jgi:hypothetical protein
MRQREQAAKSKGADFQELAPREALAIAIMPLVAKRQHGRPSPQSMAKHQPLSEHPAG